jgi:hypothetical protein
MRQPLAARAARGHAAEFVVVAMTAAALALRATQIHQSLAGDEVLAYNEIVGHGLRQTLHLVHTGVESSPPLFFVLAWLSVKLGDPTLWIRLPSILLGSATVPVVYALGRELAGRATGLIAAGVMTCAPFAVYYGIEARPYATMMFFVAVSTLALVRALRDRSLPWLAVYVVASAAAAYSHYTCVFVLAGQAAWSLWAWREEWRRLLIANGAIVALYLPWVPYLQGKDLAVYRQLYPLGTARVLTDLLRPMPGHPSAPLRAIPTDLGLAVIGVCALAGGLALARGVRARRLSTPRPAPHVALLVLLVLASPVGVLLYSLLGTDIWLPRNLSASLPATAVLLGVALAALPRPLTALSAVAVLAVLGAGTARSFDPVYARGPFRAIAGYLDRVAAPHDPITIVSLVGGPAIPAQFHKPHREIGGLKQWQSERAPATKFLVLDDTLIRLLKLGTPQAPGFTLITRRHYAGSFPTELLTYERTQR